MGRRGTYSGKAARRDGATGWLTGTYVERGEAGWRTSIRKLAPCSIACTSPACQPESAPCEVPEITRRASSAVPTAGTLAARSLY